MAKPTKIILDCDPGHDDAFAMLLAFASPELDLLGITTVGGNVPLASTTKNALLIRALAKSEHIPIFAGMDRPMVKQLVTAEHIHGETGLDTASGALLPEPTEGIEDQHGVDFIVQTCRNAADGEICLVPTGPLTNIAMALRLAPDIKDKISQIVFMGGVALDVGNVTPAAEFNIYVDPHGADVVFRSGIPLVMHGLDVTHKMLVTDERVAKFSALKAPMGPWLADLLAFFNRYDRERYDSAGAPLHDPCTIAYLIDPTIFSGKDCNLQVETNSDLTLGQTVADWWKATDHPINAKVIVNGDDERFFELLTSRLATLAEAA